MKKLPVIYFSFICCFVVFFTSCKISDINVDIEIENTSSILQSVSYFYSGTNEFVELISVPANLTIVKTIPKGYILKFDNSEIYEMHVRESRKYIISEIPETTSKILFTNNLLTDITMLSDTDTSFTLTLDPGTSDKKDFTKRRTQSYKIKLKDQIKDGSNYYIESSGNKYYFTITEKGNGIFINKYGE